MHLVTVVVFWMSGGIVVVLSGLLACSALLEKQKRAFFSASIFGVLTAGLWILIYLWGSDRSSIFLIAACLMTVLILLFSIPIGQKRALVIYPHQQRYDERNTVFARFDLEPESKRYRNYYRAHPEFKDCDDKLRLLPLLLAPGGRYYDSVRSALVESLFFQENQNINLVDGPVATQSMSLPKQTATDLIKEVAAQLGAAETGVAALNQRFVYSHVGRGPELWGKAIENRHRFVIAFTVEMRLHKINEAPFIGITEETAQQYLQAQHVSINLAAFIRRLGYPARAHVSGSNYQLILPAAAYEAGLGELGRCGFLISSRYGPRVRLGAVTTDLPLISDTPIYLGVQDFCAHCKKCAINCPSGAIPAGAKTEVRGVEKWQINSEQCYRYWRLVGTDCGLCMKVCPYSHPNTPIHALLRKGVRQSALIRRLAARADDLFYGQKSIPKFS